ncbi:MAG: hydrogenase maturation protease [Gemmataceae bacterium]|nr:hydrogenase maturation protease [Gemmataceae bacterium]
MALLLIGYGNTLRSDDGAGPLVARAAAAWGLPHLQALAVQQLTPELAEPLAVADRALFVDARVERPDGGVEVTRLGSAGGPIGLGHTGDPRWLLALAQAVYGRRPRAWLVTVPAATVAFGEQLSPTAERGVETVLALVALLTCRWYGEL